MMKETTTSSQDPIDYQNLTIFIHEQAEVVIVVAEQTKICFLDKFFYLFFPR